MSRLLLLIALLAGLSGSAFGQATPASEIAPNGKLRVGMIAITVLGGVAGPVAGFIGEKLGVTVEPVMYPNPEAYLQSFGKGEWDIAIGPRELAPADKVDFTADLWIVNLVYVAAPGKDFADVGSVDRAGVKIGTIGGAPSDRVLTRKIKAAEIVRIPLSPTIAADAAELLRSGKADVFGADAGVGYPAAVDLQGARIVPGAFATVHVAAALPKGRSAAAQAALAALVHDARHTGVVLRAIDGKGLKSVFLAPEDPLPERLLIGYEGEGEVDASPQACVATVKSVADWTDEDTKVAARKQCAARRRHVEAYEALQTNYLTLMGLLAQDIRTQPADAAENLKIMVKACIDHKYGITTGGHNIMVDVIENDIAAKCLNRAANMLDAEIRELLADECVHGLPGSC
jgi:ABC-type amino acid transport substrate-binding protein